MNIVPPPQPLSPDLIGRFKAIVGDRHGITDPAEVAPYVTEERNLYVGHSPLVLRPGSTDEVAAICKLAGETRTALVPQGGNTGLVGGQTPHHGEVVLSLRRLDRIRDIDTQSNTVTAEAGVVLQTLQQRADDVDRLFPLSLGAEGSCTIGGNLSTNAGGTGALAYGVARSMALGLEVVLADGRVLNTLTRLKKDNTGYNLHNLFIGAEGTLGVITELTVRLHPIPEAVSSAICAFETVRGAVEAVIATIQYGIPVARVEFMDEVAINAVNNYSKLGLKVAPTLFFEFHGTPAWVAEQAKVVEEITKEYGGSDFNWSADTDERNRLWQARHDSFFATKAIKPGWELYLGDICVPISKLAESIVAAREDIDNSPFTGQIIGHVGDGNYHTAYIIEPGNEEHLKIAEAMAERLVERALACGGTAAGEHGIGIEKLKFMRVEHGDGAVDAMKAIKRALDPKGIMNPGKMGDAG